jgi:hypothetical protein
MKVKMLTTEGKLKKGEIYDLDDKQARDLLTFGKAMRAKAKPATTEAAKADETKTTATATSTTKAKK